MPVGVEKEIERPGELTTGLYIHIPFCGRKCPYCDFNSVAGTDIPEARYVDAIIREVDYYHGEGGFNRPLDTLYIGGGTPSILSLSAIERIVGHIKGSFEWTPGIEATIEVNPTSIDMRKLEGYLLAGVNRLSLGVQSFNDAELRVLGRTHSSDDAINAFNMAREAGFESIGVDLIFAVPGQTVVDFKNNLERAVELRPEHISVYGLTLEEGVAMQRAAERGDIELVADDIEAACFELATKILGESGYTHYEISNFARPGSQSRHNLRYWQGRDYLGLGAGAHSCSTESADGVARTKRWWNITCVDSYMEEVEENGSAKVGGEVLTSGQERMEALYLGLRLLEGIDIEAFKARFKIAPMELLNKKAVDERLVTIDCSAGQGERLRLTPRGLLFSNEIF